MNNKEEQFDLVDNFYSSAPKHRTKDRLRKMVLNEIEKAYMEGSEDILREIVQDNEVDNSGVDMWGIAEDVLERVKELHNLNKEKDE